MNIQYPYNIDWLPEDGKPIGVFAIAGWLEKRIEEMREVREAEARKAKGFNEVHTSEVEEE